MAPQMNSPACLPPVRLQILTVPHTLFPVMFEHCAALYQLDGNPPRWSTANQASGKPHNAVPPSRSEFACFTNLGEHQILALWIGNQTDVSSEDSVQH